MDTNKLKAVRTERGMSVSELSRRTSLSRVTITELEKGIGNPTVRTVNAICKALNKKPNEVFFLIFV